MKIIIFANSKVGEEIASYLINNFPKDIGMVVTLANNSITRLAKQAGVNTIIYSTEEDVMTYINEDYYLGVLAWWPHIISKELFSIPQFGFINTHPSFLPYSKGKHPNFWSIVNEEIFGVTIHRVSESIDTGDIIAQKEIPVTWEDTGVTLYKKARIEIVTLFKEIYPNLSSKELVQNASPQIGQGSFKYGREIHSASKLDLENTSNARKLLNLLRAKDFDKHSKCWFEENGEEYEVSVSITKKMKTSRSEFA